MGRESVKEYRRRAMAAAKGKPVDIYAGHHRQQRRMMQIPDDDSDDEYDSDMDDFIEDEGEGNKFESHLTQELVLGIVIWTW